MTATTSPREHALPHWESTPADVPAATREIKRALRARMPSIKRSVRS